MMSTPMSITDSMASIEFSGQFRQSPRCETTNTSFDIGLWSSARIRSVVRSGAGSGCAVHEQSAAANRNKIRFIFRKKD